MNSLVHTRTNLEKRIEGFFLRNVVKATHENSTVE